ncbi:MAG: ATP-dependent RecD-like DNA helicase [Proteobacteria bacterium]|nr:ATP-dependent RecD-like DNA helicase [Pseudomonadota bacterium]
MTRRPTTRQTPGHSGREQEVESGESGGSSNRAGESVTEPLAGRRGQQAELDLAGDSTETLDGTLQQVVFSNQENYWTVARVRPDPSLADSEDPELVTVVGTLFGLREGTPLRMRGSWHVHPRYGRQFRVVTYQTKLPESLLGIERYLASGPIPGVGPELAKRLVERFGLETLEVIRDQPSRLKEVDGIGTARAKKIAEAWSSEHGMHDVMVFLHGYGVSPASAARIVKRYGRDTMAIIRKNPYRLALEVWGIGFKTADAIARNLGLETTAPERLAAGLIHTLGKYAEEGHVHAPERELVQTAADLLDVEQSLLGPALNKLESDSLIIRESLGDRGMCLSLTAIWQVESQAATALAELVTTPMKPLQIELDKVVAEFERDLGIQLAEAQRRAVEAVVVDKCVVITGGPGVGKTTIIRAVVSLLSARGRRLALAAPTGRAAKRLAESTGRDAATLHRLLEYQPALNGFQRDADNLLEVDALIVDEVSMVDIVLFHALLVALPSSAQLILVGDVDQLPSVGPGSVLADVIASEAATVVRLTEIFRQAAQSRIVTAAHQINHGVVPTFDPPAGTDAHRSDLYFIPRDDPGAARSTIVNLVAERIPRSFGFESLTDIQVLSPIHRGEIGTIALNEALQERLNPKASGVVEMSRGNRVFRAGDKVMQVKNNYDKSIFNGDIGVVTDILVGKQQMLVEFVDGRTVHYERDDIDQLIPAYAVSVHKSQGSEYPVVVLALGTQHYMMLQRNLLYTAITRGRKLVVVIGSPRAVAIATRNQSTNTRFTWLAERIRTGLDRSG